MSTTRKKIWILTLFPEYFKPLLDCGVIGSALRGERTESVVIEVHVINIRDYSFNRYKSVDDSPYGGGPGMIMKADVLKNALVSGVVHQGGYLDINDLHVIYTSPRGKIWNHQEAKKFARNHLQVSHTKKDLVFICGRYEGIDERFLKKYVNELFSIGDYVLSGGEIAVMAILDSSLRFLSGVLGNDASHACESFEDGLLEYPQYTRPFEFEGEKVPEVLLSGHHQNILSWQKQQQKRLTQKMRPDLLRS